MHTECGTVILPVEQFAANGNVGLNCLSQPRGQPHSHLSDVLRALSPSLQILVKSYTIVPCLETATQNCSQQGDRSV